MRICSTDTAGEIISEVMPAATGRERCLHAALSLRTRLKYGSAFANTRAIEERTLGRSKWPLHF
jgi:hypothetical protein